MDRSLAVPVGPTRKVQIRSKTTTEITTAEIICEHRRELADNLEEN
jgi:hypothetical protein